MPAPLTYSTHIHTHTHTHTLTSLSLPSQSDFTSEDFEAMPAPLTYSMFKTKSSHPLHTAIRTRREDVVFLYLVEHDSEVSRQGGRRGTLGEVGVRCGEGGGRVRQDATWVRRMRG